ncbi:50S ribosomal protein L23 [candidate division WOR-1 bacterium RIFCSPHIGHO2_01_FULL_53_15]|uniref:Large ribosomal subunit protein uL23 n=1 Tax=candidate division WOR-1 bacterium RIFCSPHIGHO2_01_FULL_53_15 TaxID=1802564 RepID=A0A1F4Q412_UNCSA|nr:MAG: 50S ribosomal protein L23 [candidate division WOR-1 bacterium RIFCSPHIGHO2_01_FULL_53_15]OGC12513.1 MAG: 50S ribosomal protein L23 [candidate division WOR-1 bacterium RIFCSPHIGHO2_02_FULL_53_26]
MDLGHVIIEQLVTEKAMTDRALGRYVFKVNLGAPKILIKQAVEKFFKVKVKDVNTTFMRPKLRTTGRSIGRTSRWKKAYVTLQPGQKIQELEA